MRLRLLRQLDRSRDGGSADCATDAFVSHHGLAWVDLSAGPFTWGPLVSSSAPAAGLRSNHSLPSVAAAFSSLPSAASPQSTRAELEAALEELADQRFAEARRLCTQYTPIMHPPSTHSCTHYPPTTDGRRGRGGADRGGA